MVKMEENEEEGLDEWREITMSPRGLLSGFRVDHPGNKSFADVFTGGEGVLGGYDEGKDVKNSAFGVAKASAKLEDCRGGCGGGGGGGGGDGDGDGGGGGSIAERRARKCGFNAAKISTPRFRTSSPLHSPAARSPYLTIPAGISPHVLLDSPLLLPNSQLSPTTGTFGAPSFDRDGQMMISSIPADADYSCDGGLSSMFKAHTVSPSPASFHDVQNQVQNSVADVDCQPLSSMHQSMDIKFPVQLSRGVGMNDHGAASPPDRKFSDALACVQMPNNNNLSMREDSGTRNSLDEDKKELYPSVGSAKTAEDGFNWRKYGQKQVKGSEYPRSYYKCTHPNCQVKKKVERSHDGQITEIIYKGAHDHPKPQPYRKSPFGSLPFNEMSDAGDCSSTYAKAEDGSVWGSMKPAVTTGPDWQIEGLERPSSASVVTEISDPQPTTKDKVFGVREPTGTPEFSSTLANYDDDDEDAATQGNFLHGDDEEKEPDLKRRKKDVCFTETTSRAVRAPRVVVQIESEVDILDDGYRWRKYGQKVVKGNPNPRSYYKCTSAGCNVRKHVERASQDLKYVITTYEGKHNHEVPAARNSSNANSGSGPLPTAPDNMHSNIPLTRNPHHLKPEPHAEDLLPPFDARMGCNNDFFRSNFLGSGAPPFYHLPNTAPYGPFGMAGHHPAYTSNIMPAIPDFPMAPPVGFPHSITNYPNSEGMLSSIQSLYAGQQFPDIDVKHIRPKQEQLDESHYNTDMRNVHNSDSSGSLYNNIMGTYPS